MSFRGRFLRVKWPNQQCQSTEGSSVPKDQASIPPGPPHRVTNLHMHTVCNNTHNTCKSESKHSEMGPVRQNPIQRTVSLFICVCIALCTIVSHNIAQNRPDSFPPYPPDDHHICSSDDVYLREGGERRGESKIETEMKLTERKSWSWLERKRKHAV